MPLYTCGILDIGFSYLKAPLMVEAISSLFSLNIQLQLKDIHVLIWGWPLLNLYFGLMQVF